MPSDVKDYLASLRLRGTRPENSLRHLVQSMMSDIGKALLDAGLRYGFTQDSEQVAATQKRVQELINRHRLVQTVLPLLPRPPATRTD